MKLDDKIYGLTMLYSEAKYNFGMWDRLQHINWDEEYKKSLMNVIECQNLYDYYNELKRFISLLNDGHSYVKYPNNIYQSDEYGYYPVELELIDNKWYVSYFIKEYQNKLDQYAEILEINGLETNEYFEKKIYPYAWHAVHKDNIYVKELWQFGKINENAKLKVKNLNGEIKEVNINRVKIGSENEDGCHFKFRDYPDYINELYRSNENSFVIFEYDDIGILFVNSFSCNDLAEDLLSHSYLLKDKKGIIIDLRYNGGGSSKNSDKLLSMFSDQQFYVGSEYLRIHRPVAKAFAVYRIKYHGCKTYADYLTKYGKFSNDDAIYSSIDGDPKSWYENYYDCHYENLEVEEGILFKEYRNIFTQPTILLIGSKTASAAETFVNGFKSIKRGLIIGNNTFGSNGNPLLVDLPYGGYAGICTANPKMYNGAEYINIGIEPDVKIEYHLEDFITNSNIIEDKEIKYAIKELLNLCK